MAYTVKNEEMSKPFEWLTEEPWTWLVDYCEEHEYTDLDDMYKAIMGEISIEEYNETNKTECTIQDIKNEYHKRFPLMLADAMIAIGNDINSGKIIIDQLFDDECEECYDHKELVNFIKENCNIKEWQKGQALDYMEHRYPLPDSVADAIDTAITEFCIENEISTDLVLSYEGTEELFVECFT